MKVEWLDRRIAKPGPYMTLCLTEDEFETAMKHLRVRNYPAFVTEGADATVHHMSNNDGSDACVVCLRGWEGRDAVEVIGLLVHEAVHIWQEYADRMGERDPGREQEAYAIQSISQELIDAFRRKSNGRA